MALKASRRAAIDPFIVMEVMRAANERAAEGGDVIHMEVGQPSTPAPAKVREAAKSALERHLIGYTDALGLPQLRRRIAQHYRDFYDVDVAAARIAVTTGSSGGFLLAFLAAFDPGDRVALAMPGYPCYRHILTAFGLEPLLIDTAPATKYQPTVAALERIEGRLDGPSSRPRPPTRWAPSCRAGPSGKPSPVGARGAVCGSSRTRSITASPSAPRQRPPPTRGHRHQQLLKYFSMTGWRLGWMVLPEDRVKPVERRAELLHSPRRRLFAIGRDAAFDAHEELQGNVARYARNRETCC